MAFDETQFPTTISTGSAGGPSYRTDIVVVYNGSERRNQVWSQSRMKFDASYGVRDFNDLMAVVKFFRAREGMVRGFRFQDPLDFSSAVNGIATPNAEDQVLGIGDGTTDEFQLIKTYSNGISTQARKIKKPVEDSVLIAVDSTLLVPTTDYSVDHTTGIVTFVTPPADESEITAGFLFDVPVRFEQDNLDLKLNYVSNGQFSIPIVEVRV